MKEDLRCGIKNPDLRAGGMALLLGALVATEDSSSAPGTQMTPKHQTLLVQRI